MSDQSEADGGGRRDSMDLLGTTVLVGFSLLLGLNQALVKLVNDAFAPVFQSGLRSLCAIVPIVLFVWWTKRRVSFTDGTLLAGVLVGLFFAAEFCLLFLALDFTSVARVSLFFYTMPFWLAIAAHFLLPGETLSAARVVGLLLAVGGVAVALIARDGAAASDDAWIGDLMALVGAMFWGAIALGIRLTSLASAPAEQVLLYQLTVSAVVLLAIAPLFGETVREVTPMLLAIFAFQVLVIAAFGFLMWTWALSIYPASDMSSFSLLAPIAGVGFGWLIFDDPLPAGFLVALGMVAAGIVLVNRR